MKMLLSLIRKTLIVLFILGLSVLITVGLFRYRSERGAEGDTWKQTVAEDTIEGYLKYLRNCQSCPHERDALDALDRLQSRRGLVARLEQGHLPPRVGITLPVFSPDGKEILAVGGRNLYFWDAFTGRRLIRSRDGFQTRGGRYLESLAYSPDGSRIAAGMSGKEAGYLILWDQKTGELLADHAVDWYDVKTVAFSPDGNSIGWSTHGPIGIWEPSSGKFLRATHEGASALAFVRRDDGKALLVTASGRNVWFWDVASMEVLKRSELDTERSLLGLSQDGLLVAFRQGSVLELWDTRLGTLIASLGNHESEITAFCRESRKGWIAAGTKGGTLYLWDLAEAKRLGSVLAHDGPIEHIACSKQGKVVTTSWDAAKIWDLETLRASSEQ